MPARPGAGRPKGQKKFGGRKAGTPNKITFDLMETLRAKGFDPAAKLLELALKSEDAFDRAGIFSENAPGFIKVAIDATAKLSRMVYPERKAVDVTSGGESLGNTVSEIIANAITAGVKKDDPSKDS